MHVSFDDNKVNGKGNDGDHEILRFKNEGLNSDDSEDSDKMPNFDDLPNSGNIEDSDQNSRKDATVEGEQLSESLTRPESNSTSGNLSESITSKYTLSESTSSDVSHTLTNSSTDETQSQGIDSGGDSENFFNSNKESMDDGGVKGICHNLFVNGKD